MLAENGCHVSEAMVCKVTQVSWLIAIIIFLADHEDFFFKDYHT